MQILGILAFVIALLISVMIHEFGHFITARKFGMKVTEFFVGFGKRLWSITRGETEYGLKAIPAGGYCRIEGMTPRDQMPPDQAHRAFFLASSGKKLIVLGAGSFAHFLLGFLLIFSIFFGIGVNTLVPIVSNVGADTPAAVAGILVGDEIKSINGKRVNNWIEDSQAIPNSKGKPLALIILREGREISITATPIYISSEKRYMLGISASVGNKRESFLPAISNSGRATWVLTRESAKSLVALPTKIPQLIRQTFGGQERDPNGLVGVVGAAKVSGDALSSSKLNGTERLATFILLIASLNIFIGLFNLLPLLPLDGGHMAVAIADEIRALVARVRGRARPAGIDVNVLTPITMAVFAVLAVLTVILLIADIFNPVSLNL